MVRAMAAHLDEDWPNFGDVAPVPEGGLPQHKGRAAATQLILDHEDLTELRDCSCFPGKLGSTEDLVSCVDEKISVCFGNVPAKTENISAVSAIAEDTLLEKDEIWNALTSNYGRATPVDWNQSRTRSLYISTFNLEEKPRKADVVAELSDEEELREQLDMHSIIVPCLAEEPLVTAEQVIEEIEEMMQDSSDMEAEHHPSQSDLSMLSLDIHRTSPGFEERVKALSIAELVQRLEEAESNVRRFSEELVQQLAIRDELDFEKEVKNSFISVLIDVQNRQKEHRESVRKKKKLKGGGGTTQGLVERNPGSRFSMEGLSSVIQSSFRQTFGNGCTERQYLTTVIPYEKKGHPLSVEDLQVLTKILQAMRDDSDKVPGLLTDYILNVFCPT